MPPRSAAEVTVYDTPPPVYREIGVLQAHRRTVFSPSLDAGTKQVLQRLRTEAAKLGANGLIFEGFDSTQSGAVDGGASSQAYSAHGEVGLGLGLSIEFFEITGRGRAILVPDATG